jgi:hypothetical protein
MAYGRKTGGRVFRFAWACDHKELANKADGLCQSCYSKAYGKHHYEQNKPKILKEQRERWRNTRRAAYLKRLYGITPEQYEEMERKFNGTCWICGGKPRTRKLAVDHCHKTGKVRGVLCGSCNRGLQFFRDKPALFRRAADYLEGLL